MENGWVKLYRKSMDSRVFRNDALWKLWTWCLMKAAHKECWVSIQTGIGETEVQLKPGQFVFGRKQAAQELKMKPSSVRNRMVKLQKLKNLVVESNTHFSIITICNWDEYQGQENKKGQAEGQPEDNQRTTRGQPEDTYKNEKNVKNEKNEKKNNIYAQSCKDSSEPPILSIPLAGKDKFFDITQTMIDEWQEDFPGVDILRELRKCRAWNKANPARRKTLRGIRRHIVWWLSGAQDKAPPAKKKPPRCLLEPEGGFENKVYVGATPPEELANISWLQDDDDDKAMEA